MTIGARDDGQYNRAYIAVRSRRSYCIQQVELADPGYIIANLAVPGLDNLHGSLSLPICVQTLASAEERQQDYTLDHTPRLASRTR